MSSTNRFWVDCGYRPEMQTKRHLVLDDALLATLFDCPELAAQTATEQALLDQLKATPRADLDVTTLETEAQENWRIALRFRDHLLQAPTPEAAYLDIISGRFVTAPPLLAWLTRRLLRHLLGSTQEPLAYRCAELFYRPQCLHRLDECTVLIDAEAAGVRTARQPLDDLIRQAGGKPREVIELAQGAALAHYDQPTASALALDLRPKQPASEALCTLLESWLFHFFALDVELRAVDRIEHSWRWHIGLDEESTHMLNALYRGESVAPPSLQRFVALWQLQLPPHEMLDMRLGEQPLLLALAADEQGGVRMKPQNLLLNLPFSTH